MSGLRQFVSVAALGVVALTTSSAGAVDFDTEIVPVFTKAGCNAGSCHGAAAGRGGFKLSLLGGDPAADYDAIVLERKGRRVNLAHPAESLLLAKPTGDAAARGRHSARGRECGREAPARLDRGRCPAAEVAAETDALRSRPRRLRRGQGRDATSR